MSDPQRLTLRFVVEAVHHGIRIEQFLAKHLRTYSPFRLQRHIVAGLVTVDERPVDVTTRVRRGDEVVIHLVEPPDEVTPTDPVSQSGPASLPVLFDDPWLLGVDKPAGQVTHPVATHQHGTTMHLAQTLLDRQSVRRGLLRPGVVHRLDRMTSGVLVLAKTGDAHRSLTQQFESRIPRKSYFAVVSGSPEWSVTTLDQPIGVCPRVDSILMTTAADARNPKPAETLVRVRLRCGAVTLIEARPRTGRLHQIRVHLASAGHPVIGDRFYGNANSLRFTDRLIDAGVLPKTEAESDSRHLLHAASLSVLHPVTQERLTLHAPCPQDMRAALLAGEA